MVALQSPQKIDKAQAQHHLELLGYKRGDRVYMRYIHPNPGDGQAKSIKKSKLNWDECSKYQSQEIGRAHV